MIVLDASAGLELLGNSQSGRKIRQRTHRESLLHAPQLIDLEVMNALRRQLALGSLDEERGFIALAHFRNLRILRYPHGPYLRRVWELRHNFSAYDACYLALAESLGATLITRDVALSSARLRRGGVEVI